MMTERLIALEGVFNFRDFGGYATSLGRPVRRNVLFRSAHLARSTPEDQERIADIGIRVVTDLRRLAERQAEPSAWRDGAAPREIATDQGETSDLPPHMQFLRDTEDLAREDVRDYMLGTYARIPYEERHVELFSRAFTALADGETPILIHCAAGKDRTGVLCALILETLGVSRSDIAADYELTNVTANIEGILKQATRRFAKRIKREIDPEVIRPMIGVNAAYLQRALETIEARSGSVETYVETVLGVDAGRRSAIGEHLLEPA